MADEEPPPPLPEVGLHLEQFPPLTNSTNLTKDLPHKLNTSQHLQQSSQSFVQAVKGISTAQEPYDSGSLKPPPSDFDLALLKMPSRLEGKPAMLFQFSEKLTLVNKLKFVLLGKFSHGKPNWSSIQKFFYSLKLKGTHNLSIFDHKHVYIECSHKEDFDRIWLNLVWSIDGYVMRVFKWTPNFNVLHESPIAPVWIRLVGLPLYLFDEISLWNISNVIGKPLRIDPRNLNRSMLNSARACVELDVTKPLVEKFKVGFVDDSSGVMVESFEVQVIYDMVPPYCNSCWHIGHDQSMCKRNVAAASNSEQVVNIVNPCSSSQNDNNVPKNTGANQSVRNATQVWKTIGRKKAKNSQEETPNDLPSERYLGNRFKTLSLPQDEVSYSAATQQKEIGQISESIQVDDVEQEEQIVDGIHKEKLLQIVEVNKTIVVNDQVALSVSEVAGQIASRGDEARQFGVSEQTKDSQTELEQADQDNFQNSKDASVDCSNNAIVFWEGADSVEQIDEDAQCKDKGLLTDVVATENEVASQAIVLVTEPVLADGLEFCNKAKGANSHRDEAPEFQQITATNLKQANVTSSEGADTQLQTTPHLVPEEELQQITLEAVQAVDSVQIVKAQNSAQEVSIEANLNDVSAVPKDRVNNLKLVVMNIVATEEHSKPTDPTVQEVLLGKQITNTGQTFGKGTNIPITSKIQEDPSTQEWQVVGKKNNKTKGVVTRSQTKNANNTWADKVDDEQVVDQTPISTKIQASNKATQDYQALMKERTRLTNKMDKLFVRLSNNNMRDGIKRQITAELRALKAEYSLLL